MGSKYKVGDKVVITPLGDRLESDFSFYYMRQMSNEYSGKTATIERVEKRDRSYAHIGTIPDDGYVYYIDLDGGRYKWASSMFKDTHKSLFKQRKDDIKEIQEVLKPKYKGSKYELKFNI